MTSDRSLLKELQKLPNVGPATAGDLVLLGVRGVDDLRTRSADDLYEELCIKTGQRQDPCVWDTFASIVHFAQTGERKKWWDFTEIRKSTGTLR